MVAREALIHVGGVWSEGLESVRLEQQACRDTTTRYGGRFLNDCGHRFVEKVMNLWSMEYLDGKLTCRD